jgi:hypothetical protein
MDKIDLSPEVRRRLWRGYSIFLKLAEEPEEDTLKETELCETIKSTRTTEANELTRLNDNDDTTGAEQMNEEELAEERARKAQIHNETTRATQEG